MSCNAAILLAVLAVAPTEGNAGTPHLADKVINTLAAWNQVFEHSKIEFKYQTQIGEHALAFYKAKAISRSRLTNNAVDETLLDDAAIKNRKTRDISVILKTNGDLESIVIEELLNGVPKKRFFRHDGERYYVSHHENRWDILSSDTVPVSTPQDLLMSMPNSIASMPMSRAMLKSDGNLISWLKNAVLEGESAICGEGILRVAGPATDDHDNQLRDVLEFRLNPHNGQLTEILQWRVSGENVKTWRDYNPKDYEVQIISFANYVEIIPGISMPGEIEAKFQARWQTVLNTFPLDVRKEVVSFTGLPDEDIDINPITHIWKIVSTELDPKFSEADFVPPTEENVVIFDYLLRKFQ